MSGERKVAVYYKINGEEIHHVILVDKDKPLHDQLMNTQLMGINVQTKNLQGISIESMESPFKYKMKGRENVMSIEHRPASWLLEQADKGNVEDHTVISMASETEFEVAFDTAASETATDSDWTSPAMGLKTPEKIPIVYFNHVVQGSEIDQDAIMASKTEKFDITFKPGSKHEHDFMRILQNIEEKLAIIEDCACLPKAYLANAAVKTLKEDKRNIVTTPEPTLNPKRSGGGKRRSRRRKSKKRKSKKRKSRRRRRTKRR